MTNSWLERAKTEGTPLIDGEQVTFVWAGDSAPVLVGDFNDWEADTAVPMHQTAPGVWTHSIRLPRNAFMEYAYLTDVAKAQTDDGRVLDPFNPRTKWNGMTATQNIFTMPEAMPTPLVKRQRGIRRGTLTRHKVDVEVFAAGKQRDVWLYQPPVDQPVPLLVVYDGRDYLKQACLDAIVDNLIAAGRMAPVAMALLGNGRMARMMEYACSEMTLGFLLTKILPLAQQKLNLIDINENPGAYGIMGASMGGVMSLYTGLRLPHIFGKVLSQSGAFSIMGVDLVVHELVRDGAVRPLTIWMDVGQFEWLLPTNRQMHDLLLVRGYAVTYREYPAGHNYYAWRDDVAAGLETLFGP